MQLSEAEKKQLSKNIDLSNLLQFLYVHNLNDINYSSNFFDFVQDTVNSVDSEQVSYHMILYCINTKPSANGTTSFPRPQTAWKKICIHWRNVELSKYIELNKKHNLIRNWNFYQKRGTEIVDPRIERPADASREKLHPDVRLLPPSGSPRHLRHLPTHTQQDKNEKTGLIVDIFI